MVKRLNVLCDRLHAYSRFGLHFLGRVDEPCGLVVSLSINKFPLWVVINSTTISFFCFYLSLNSPYYLKKTSVNSASSTVTRGVYLILRSIASTSVSWNYSKDNVIWRNSSWLHVFVRLFHHRFYNNFNILTSQDIITQFTSFLVTSELIKS